jgi:sulfonate dioxygenase
MPLFRSSLLSAATAVIELTPYIGTQLEGIQLSELTDLQKDELALLVAEVSRNGYRYLDASLITVNSVV